MSLIASNCHGYKVTGLTGWPATPSKVWIFGWFRPDVTVSGQNRAIAQITDNNLDGTHDYVGLEIDGSQVLVGKVRTGNTNGATPDPGNFYLWNGSNVDKWTVGCAVFDQAASADDLKCIYGRAASVAVAATTQSGGTDIVAIADTLDDLYVAADRRKVGTGSGTTNDGTNSTKVAYIAIGYGSVPSQANIQSCIDGMHPADLAGVFEYWNLTDSGSGLVGAKLGLTLAPFGGSATTTWDGADNPTVSAPSGGGGGETLMGMQCL